MNQTATYELLTKHPHATVAELAEIVSPNGDHGTMVRVKQDILSNLIRLRKKGYVESTHGDKPYRWTVVL